MVRSAYCYLLYLFYYMEFNSKTKGYMDRQLKNLFHRLSPLLLLQFNILFWKVVVNLSVKLCDIVCLQNCICMT